MQKVQPALRVLVVENDSLIALYIADMAREAGWQVAGPARTYEEAERVALSSKLDGAILDIRLGDGKVSLPVASILKARGVPFLFATSWWSPDHRPGFEDVPVLQKPFSCNQFLSAVRQHIERRPKNP